MQCANHSPSLPLFLFFVLIKTVCGVGLKVSQSKQSRMTLALFSQTQLSVCISVCLSPCLSVSLCLSLSLSLFLSMSLSLYSVSLSVSLSLSVCLSFRIWHFNNLSCGILKCRDGLYIAYIVVIIVIIIIIIIIVVVI